MAFTAQDVKKLREMTNVGMMDCKAALAATMANAVTEGKQGEETAAPAAETTEATAE